MLFIGSVYGEDFAWRLLSGVENYYPSHEKKFPRKKSSPKKAGDQRSFARRFFSKKSRGVARRSRCLSPRLLYWVGVVGLALGPIGLGVSWLT